MLSILHRDDVFAYQELTDDEGPRRQFIGTDGVWVGSRQIELLAEAIRRVDSVSPSMTLGDVSNWHVAHVVNTRMEIIARRWLQIG